MKKLLLLVLMLATAFATAQQPAGAPAQQQKEIKDPAEYQAYVGALQTADPNAKAAALEGYLAKYPASVVKEDALEALMGAYQQAGNGPKLEATAQALLQVNPASYRGLLIAAFFSRSKIEGGQTPKEQIPQVAQQALDYSIKGLQALQSATPPGGTDPNVWATQKKALTGVFNSTAGFAALQLKDYAKAQQYLSAAAADNPNDLTVNYQLALSYLERQPVDPTGLWYGARAAGLAPNAQAADQITRYVRNRYIKFHGDDTGLPELMAAAKTSATPPAGWSVTPAPTPPEQAAKMVASKQVKDMSFDEIEFILTSGNQQAADQVWNAIKDKPIALEGKLINLTAAKLTVAGTVDDMEGNKADIDLTMAAEIPAKALAATVLKEGDTIQFQGTPKSFTPNPFMVQMEAGSFVAGTGKKVGAALAAKPTPGRATPGKATPGKATGKTGAATKGKAAATKKAPPK